MFSSLSLDDDDDNDDGGDDAVATRHSLIRSWCALAYSRKCTRGVNNDGGNRATTGERRRRLIGRATRALIVMTLVSSLVCASRLAIADATVNAFFANSDDGGGGGRSAGSCRSRTIRGRRRRRRDAATRRACALRPFN